MSVFIEPLFNKYYSKFPLILVDVGASGGFTSSWKPALKYSQVIGFEPDEREYENLEKRAGQNIKYLKAFLYSEAREIKFHLNRKQMTSSMFRPNGIFLRQFPETERLDVFSEIMLKTDTLDHQLEVNKIRDVDFIKIDTEGSEFFILQGAVDAMRRGIFGFEIEVEYASLHEGQPQFSDVDTFMKKQNFYLFDLKNYYWKRTEGRRLGKTRGQIVFADTLYLRTPEAVVAIIESIADKEQAKAKALKTFAICALYGYFDYAMELFQRLKDRFSDEEQVSIHQWLVRHTGWSYRIPLFGGRHRLSKLFYHLSEFFKVPYNEWATVERELGNK